MLQIKDTIFFFKLDKAHGIYLLTDKELFCLLVSSVIFDNRDKETKLNNYLQVFICKHCLIGCSLHKVAKNLQFNNTVKFMHVIH